LNDLYRRIINRNSRLKKLTDLNAPEVIVRNEKRMLQQSVDALFDNNRCKRPILGSGNRPLKSLTDLIKGKQGRFRENLLGKRVDYSARSVIVVGPSLKLYQCGLPKKIALELYQPFIVRRLKELDHADTIKSAKKMLERKDEEVWDILEEVIQNHPVLLNRAPTLHRMGIQAFEPVLVEGNAIKLHPLVCKGFNADFDGDQMAVHLPLSIEAQVEAHTLMLSTHNIFSPQSGQPIIAPSQDVVMGCFYMTTMIPDSKGDGMTFSSVDEVITAWSQRVLDLHATIKVRMPDYVVVKGENAERTGSLVVTTVGRVLFNDMLPKTVITGDDGKERRMPYYNLELRGSDLAKVISDCHEILGRRDTIDLLDDMNQLGFRESTRSGLSFATDDLITPPTKGKIIGEAEKTVLKSLRRYEDGIITDAERYNQVLDSWTHARELITREMMEGLENDYGGNRYRGYVNPIHLMVRSGARGGVEQIRQLAGMRGLMAKPSGEIIETPIKANFREGLTVLEYFSSTHGARKGLADTALKTADSGYLTRKLADVAQNVVITCHDCGTPRGVTKGTVRSGQKIEVPLQDAIKGRVSRTNIVTVTDEVLVRENELITVDIARRIAETMGEEQKIQVRSPMTCEAPLGVCTLCYGMDLSTNRMAEQGLAVGTIAAQSIGEPGTQLTMRTFHIGGTAARAIEENELRTKKGGRTKFAGMKAVVNDSGQHIALNRTGAVLILDAKGRELEKHEIPIGSELHLENDADVNPGDLICKWDPHSIPILAGVGGIVRLEDVIEGETMKKESDLTGKVRFVITEHKGDAHPQIILEGTDGKIIEFHYLPEKAHIEVVEGSKISAGTLLAKTPREVSGTQDITGGLPRVTEIFEARKPKEPAVIAEIDGTVELLGEKRRGKRTITVRSDSGIEREHLISHGKPLRVHAGMYVKAGTPLVDGPRIPHDILRISGEEAVQSYLVEEIQNVYRSQRVEINDKHIEIIVAQMLKRVKVHEIGDTDLLPGMEMDKHQFGGFNKELESFVKVVAPGSTDLDPDSRITKEQLAQINEKVLAEGGTPAEVASLQFATAEPQLLGITKAAVQSASFISAASFQETTKVLAEAALAGKEDRLVGLKENVILGHLVPAGTGFKAFQNAEVKISPEALVDLEPEVETVANYPLIDAGEEMLQKNAEVEMVRSEGPSPLDELIGDLVDKDAPIDKDAPVEEESTGGSLDDFS